MAPDSILMGSHDMREPGDIQIHENHADPLARFIELNEQWIAPAVALCRSLGFEAVVDHAETGYSRCNLIMRLEL